MYNAPILKKALDILKLIVKENQPLSVTQIAQKLSISKSTTFGILKSLEEEGFLFKDIRSKKYTTGSTLFELAKTVLGRVDVVVAARPHLEELMAQVDETICLGIREGKKVKIIDVLDPGKDFKVSSKIGTRFNLTGVIGKIFLSAFSDTEVHTILIKEGLRRYTENSICDIDQYMKELNNVRQLGYAVDLEEYIPGVRAIGALIHAGHMPLAGVWILGFTGSMNDEKLPAMVNHLKTAVNRINSRLSPFVIDDDNNGG
jgi:IclR family transcriptional regulator, KDG regulon repressor